MIDKEIYLGKKKLDVQLIIILVSSEYINRKR
jgi:hypothetical protein